MSWLTFNIDLARASSALDRIASALERISPPPLPDSPPPDPVSSAPSSPPQFGMSESPEQYQERTSHEANLAISLGVAPWSPAFQQAVDEMRAELIVGKVELDEETGALRRVEFTSEQADDLIRRAFMQAKSAANER